LFGGRMERRLHIFQIGLNVVPMGRNLRLAQQNLVFFFAQLFSTPLFLLINSSYQLFPTFVHQNSSKIFAAPLLLPAMIADPMPRDLFGHSILLQHFTVATFPLSLPGPFRSSER